MGSPLLFSSTEWARLFTEPYPVPLVRRSFGTLIDSKCLVCNKSANDVNDYVVSIDPLATVHSECWIGGWDSVQDTSPVRDLMRKSFSRKTPDVQEVVPDHLVPPTLEYVKRFAASFQPKKYLTDGPTQSKIKKKRL